jgi:uncharacterized protein YqeY
MTSASPSGLVEQVSRDITDAMRAKDQGRLVALRMLKAAFMNREIERGHALDDAEAQQVVSTLIKQRRDSIDQFTKANRQDLVSKETAEIAVLDTYLPPALSREEVEQVVAAAIASTGASSPKDMGLVMKATMAALAGRNAEGKLVNEVVRAKLQQK